MEIYHIQSEVEKLLKDIPETRDSDELLYIMLCKKLNPQASKLGFEAVFCNRALYGLPQYQSVERARRKLQHSKPELRCSDGVSEKRYNYWKVIRAYAEAEI